MSSPAPVEIAAANLPFLAGWLAGAADYRFGGGPRWTMMVFVDMEAGKLTIDYLYRLEDSIRRRWPEGETAPTLRDMNVFFKGR